MDTEDSSPLPRLPCRKENFPEAEDINMPPTPEPSLSQTVIYGDFNIEPLNAVSTSQPLVSQRPVVRSEPPATTSADGDNPLGQTPLAVPQSQVALAGASQNFSQFQPPESSTPLPFMTKIKFSPLHDFDVSAMFRCTQENQGEGEMN